MSKEKQYDVLVIGGGIAGMAAALESARSGLQTALVEKTILWGGLATSGLVPQKVENSLVVGRCTSAEGYAWQVTRLIPAAALSGQIAGMAAALAIRGQTSPDRLDVKDIQKVAQSKGFVLHI